MKNILFSFGFLLLVFQNLSAQNIENDIRMEVVKKVINAYNNHNYKSMKQPWVTWAKIFVTEKN